jgi:transposase
MPMRPDSYQAVPPETLRVALAAFPNGHPYLRLRDELGPLFANEAFAHLFYHRGRPAKAPARLALVSLLQFAEGLSDRQAADGVRSRLEWKYLLGLELTDPGFDHTVLSEFRERLVAGGAETLIFDLLLEQIRAHGWLKARGTQRTDATHVLAAVRGLNRLQAVGEAVRHSLNVLATVAPAWLQSRLEPAWFTRYERSFEETRLPQSDKERRALAETIGSDGFRLLQALWEEAAAGTEWAWLWNVPAVEVLRQMWVQQYYREEGPAAATGAVLRLRWRREDEFPPAALAINSPYDAEARWGRKRSMGWMGYKVHLTETCEPNRPHLITDVQTTTATVADTEVVPAIHTDLAARGLLPAQHLVDSGYVDAGRLAESQEREIDLCGPPRGNSRWQARAGGFTAEDFSICWEAQQATCPGGRRNVRWHEGKDRWGSPTISIAFGRQDCRECVLRSQCTRSQANGRVVTVRPREQQEALWAARQRESSEEFRREYAARAGIEGTVSQAVHACAVRRCRYLGLAKTRLQHILTAAALNLRRLGAWLIDPRLARTRQAAFTRLAAVAT